jgi:hypothetical protein
MRMRLFAALAKFSSIKLNKSIHFGKLGNVIMSAAYMYGLVHDSEPLMLRLDVGFGQGQDCASRRTACTV